MRTLKKTLSLVLVVAMVLGLCVVGASAYNKVEDFTDDVSKIGTAYYEAVGVLTGIGIIDGMTETAFEPQGNYTREQAAKIIAYMQLGKAKADSLKCTVAPFEDVAASRWSAGYIAYCVEQGIIDGMTETTFEPTAKLTGFQWAKMLLCAVGFGVNGEFTGSSWSVNTAKVAHTVDLFAGDLAGADHTALTREQAALYAFNVLTSVDKVAYSPNVTSYVYGIQGYETVNGIGSTLAEDVFDLYNVVGIVVDSEGLGAPATVVNVKGNYTVNTAADLVSVVADTDIDMMYHAARVWYVGKDTGVFTYDLAKTTKATCLNITSAEKNAASKVGSNTFKIGEDLTNVNAPYEYSFIDNSAYDNSYAGVELYANIGNVGYTNSVNKTIKLNSTSYALSSVKTDMTDIAKGDYVVFVKANSKTESGKYGIHMYATSATSGIVKSVSQSAGKVISVTLSDGTVLPMSVLYDTVIPDDIEKFVIGNVYSFILDNHGDIVTALKNGVRDLWAFTGDYKLTNEFNTWVSDYVAVAQFVNVTTGEEKEFPVYTINDFDFDGARGEYFDISASTKANGLYVATPIDETNNIYAGKYVIDGLTLIWSGNTVTYTFKTKDNVTFFDDDTVEFIVATGTGSKLDIQHYTGTAALKEAFKVAKNGTLELENVALTGTYTSTGHFNASTIFVLADNLSTYSNYVFVPEDVTADDWTTVTGDPASYVVGYDVGYLEGEKVTVYFTPGQLDNQMTLRRGFYTYTYNALGLGEYMLIERTYNGQNDCYYEAVDFTNTAVKNTWLFNNKFRAVEGEVVIVDLTAYQVKSLQELYDACEDDSSLKLAFTTDPTTGRVDYIYVVKAGLDSRITVTLDNELVKAGWTLEQSGWADVDPDKAGSIKVVLVNKKADLGIDKTARYNVTVNDEAADAVYEATNKLSVTINYDPSDFDNQDNAKFEIDGLELTVKVGVAAGVDARIVSGGTSTIRLGESVTVTVKPPVGDDRLNAEAMVYTIGTTSPYQTVTGKVMPKDNSTAITFYPVVGEEYTFTYELTQWVYELDA